MPEITPEERVQKVKSRLLEDLEFEPEQVVNFYTRNIFQRALAHLVGRAATASKMLRCTEAGELKTAPTTTGIEHYGVAAGDGTDAYTTYLSEAFFMSRFDIFIWDNPALVRLAMPPDVWGEGIEVPPGFYSVECRAKAVSIKNKTVGQTARYQVVGWW